MKLTAQLAATFALYFCAGYGAVALLRLVL